MLTCAQLATRAELYGKARSFLETSIAIRPRLEAYQLLASLMEQLGERERSVKALNDALAFAVGRKAKLPKIRARRWLDRRHERRRTVMPLIRAITLLPSQQVIIVEEGETILDAALRAGLNLPHSCKGGHCSSCRAQHSLRVRSSIREAGRWD